MEVALGLLAESAGSATDDLQRAQVERLRAQIEAAVNPGREAPVLLLRAAARLEALDVRLSRDTYLEAWMASFMAGRMAQPGGLLPEVSRAVRLAPPPPSPPTPCDLFLDGVATVVTEGRSAAAPSLRGAIDAFLGDRSIDEWLQWGHYATHAACTLWDADSWEVLSARHVELARASGALTPLAVAVSGRVIFAAWSGDFEAATALAGEEAAIKDATGIGLSYGALLLAALRGRQEEASALIAAAVADSVTRGRGMGSQVANWFAAVLYNGLGHYHEACDAAVNAAAIGVYGQNVTAWALPELIEAAVRSGKPDLADDALRRLLAETDVEDSDWATGIEARSRALVHDGSVAEQCYLEAVERLGRTPLRTELARAHLLYGEWLRREQTARRCPCPTAHGIRHVRRHGVRGVR